MIAMLWVLVAIGWIFVSLKLGVPSEAVLSLSLVLPHGLVLKPPISSL